MSDREQKAISPPYATGGGGTVLEHRYGAVLLAHLLEGDPLPLLGDHLSPVSVLFQASAFSAVDDLLVLGRTSDGMTRRISIGVRRDPQLVASDKASAGLLAAYIRVLTAHWQDIQAGVWRLGLVVASRSAAVQQVRELCVIARDVPDEETFRSAVKTPGRTNQGVRDRLQHVDDLVRIAAKEVGVGHVSEEELCWRLLSALRVGELRLEGVDETDRTLVVGRLRAATRDGTPDSADVLFCRLVDLADRYAPAGAEITESLLRRDLSGTALARSKSYLQAWTLLDGLGERLQARTRFGLGDGTQDLELERADARDALRVDLTRAAITTAALVVVGEPDVGKSSLTLRATEQMKTAGAVVTSLSLQDLPRTTIKLEALLGARLTDVFGATATGPGRLLVIDGAESVLEGRGPVLFDLATAALNCGVGVVSVTRRDGAAAVEDELRKASEAAGRPGPPTEHGVASLTSAEASALTSTFSSLARLAAEPRAAWLLARPGLVDLLLRAGAAGDLPTGPLSEADLFAAIWYRLVRGQEITRPGGPSPDARDRALTSLARRQLLPGSPGEAPDADALPSLRSDGLLLPPGPTGAWAPGDQFGSDLVRDFAVARLLITDGFEVLDLAGAPRWALRAVRLACQSKLAGSTPNFESTRVSLQAAFDDLAERHGQRWAEIPSEALLTLGSAREALSSAWPALLANNRSGLQMLLRLALQRYCPDGTGDPFVLAPLAELGYCGGADLGQDKRRAQGCGAQIREVIRAWLTGLAKVGDGPLQLRRQVRDRLLDTNPEGSDEFAVEVLGMLGPDLDQRAEIFLRELARDRAGHLGPAVESIGPVLAMSAHQPDLLLTLAEAFYILPRAASWSGLDSGIRHHSTGGGLGRPMAGWHRGPFYRLLHASPEKTLAMINRLLDHGVSDRVRQLHSLGTKANSVGSALPGLDLDLPGAGTRHCVGDDHAWCWYRGSGVGPYPCISALLAVELYADHLITVVGEPVGHVVDLLLRECNNLAMPGLVVGLLVRHLADAGDQMDRWLVRPEVWQLEFSRAVKEGRFHIQGADPPTLFGHSRREYDLRHVATELTAMAMSAGDTKRLAALGEVADDLVQYAREQLAGAGAEADPAKMAMVEGWASSLRSENYRVDSAEDGGVLFHVTLPDDVASALAPNIEVIDRGNGAFRVLRTYGGSESRVASVETLIEDIEVARELAESPPAQGPPNPADPPAAVASSAIVAHAQGRIAVDDESLRWAVEVLLAAAEYPNVDFMSHESSLDDMGADRSAGAALPALLLPAFDGIEFDRPRVEAALQSCATSLFDEVRAALVVGARLVWAAPCGSPAASRTCRHQTVWTAIEHGLRECQLGNANDPTSDRLLPEPIDGPYDRTLPTVETERLLVHRLTPPIVAAADALRSVTCVRGSIGKLLPSLYEAHRRGSGHWATAGYQDAQRPRVVRVLVEAAVEGHPQQLTAYVRSFISNGAALDHLLRDLAFLFTYDETLRLELPAVWRQVMTTALDAFDGLGDEAIMSASLVGLLPTPQMDLAHAKPEAAIGPARQSWVAPTDIADLVERWLPIVRGDPQAADAVAQLAQCSSPGWQATTGLVWVEDLIGGDYAAIARNCYFLVSWLEDVRSSSQLDVSGTARWRRIIDGLAAKGDGRAVKLQQAEE